MNNSLAEPSSQSYEADSQMILYWHCRPLLPPGSHHSPGPLEPASQPASQRGSQECRNLSPAPPRSPLSFLLSYSSSALTSLYFSFPISNWTGQHGNFPVPPVPDPRRVSFSFVIRSIKDRVRNISRCLKKRLDLGQTFIKTEVDLIILVSLFIYILIIIIWCR